MKEKEKMIEVPQKLWFELCELNMKLIGKITLMSLIHGEVPIDEETLKRIGRDKETSFYHGLGKNLTDFIHHE